jgi:hypothetical protein
MTDSTINGLITTNLQTVGVKVEMDEAIVLLPTWDVPLQTRLGSAPAHEVRVDWLEDTLTPSTVTWSAVSGSSSPWTLTVADTSNIRLHDVLRDEAQSGALNFEVTTITADTSIVVTDTFSTGIATPASTGTADIVGQNVAEGGDPLAMRSVDRTNPYNYTQVGQEGVTVSRTERKRQTYGVADEYTYQVQKKFKELAIRMERCLTNGVRYQSGANRQMGGLFYYITTNSRSNTVANAKSAVNSLVRDAYTQGGTPTVLYCSPAVKAALSANIDPTLRRTTGADTQVGFVVDRILTDFGLIDVVTDRHFPTTKALLLQEEFDKRRVFDGYFHETLAQTGDATKGEIIGEFSLEVKNQKAQGVLTLTDAS